MPLLLLLLCLRLASAASVPLPTGAERAAVRAADAADIIIALPPLPRMPPLPAEADGPDADGCCCLGSSRVLARLVKLELEAGAGLLVNSPRAEGPAAPSEETLLLTLSTALLPHERSAEPSSAAPEAAIWALERPAPTPRLLLLLPDGCGAPPAAAEDGFCGRSGPLLPPLACTFSATTLPTQLTPAARAACISGFLTRAREPRRCKGWRQQNVVSKVTWDAGSGSQYEMWERERGMGCFEERSCQGGNETDFPR